MDAPVQYTNVRGQWVAYQVTGGGPRDVVLVPGFVTNIDTFWDSPVISRFLVHVGSCARLIQFDRRGTGLSDRAFPGPDLLAEWARDPIAVMDAVGSERAVLMAWDTACAPAIRCAAQNPDRVEGLILMQPFASSPLAGMSREISDGFVAAAEQTWGEGNIFLLTNPELDRIFLEGFVGSFFGKFERSALEKGQVRAHYEAMATFDVEDDLAQINVPTLVFHSDHNAFVSLAAGQQVADALGAQLIRFDSPNLHEWLTQPDIVQAAVSEFLLGDDATTSRSLATILFCDVAGSTERAASQGDRRWHANLDSVERLIARAVEAHNGRVVKTTGDGALAVFAQPSQGARAAVVMRESLGGSGTEVRIGLHVGEVELRGDDVAGLAVHIAARVQAAAGAGEIFVTRTVRDLVVGASFKFEERGPHALKGVPDEWELYAL